MNVLDLEGHAPGYASAVGAMCCADLEGTVERMALRMLEAGEVAVRAAYDRLHAAQGKINAASSVLGGALAGDVASIVEEAAVGPEATAHVAEQEVKGSMEGGAAGIVDALVSWAMSSDGAVLRAMVSRCARASPPAS